MTPLQLFLQQLLNGLTLGAIYALIALGYTMIYGVIQLINFAHGEVFMVGAYAALTIILILSPVGLPWWILLVVCGLGAMACCGAVGAGIERTAYRPIRQAPRLNALITAIGMSFFLQNALMLIYGATDRQFPSLIPLVRWQIAGVSMTLMQLVVWISGAILMVGLHLLVMSTKLGKAMRAIAQDLTACALLGIPVNRVIAVTFTIGSALAAMGGVLFGLNYGTINFHDGYLTGLKAFTAAVLGGIGNVTGAALGGFLLGILGAMTVTCYGGEWENVGVFTLLVVILVFRPTGLLGEETPER